MTNEIRFSDNSSAEIITNSNKLPQNISFLLSCNGEEKRISNKHTSENIDCNITLDQVTSGFIINFDLTLKKAQKLDFCGISVGKLQIADNNKFFGTIPGFLEKDGIKTAKEAESESEPSAMLGIYAPENGNSILCGIGDINPEKSEFTIYQSCLRAGYAPERIMEGKVNFKVFFSINNDPLESLENFGSYLGKFARKIPETPTGWNSWDFYGAAVSMDDLEKEMAHLQKLPFRNKLDYFTIDMGWENMWGDWQPNRKFPASLKEIADKIKSNGWKPGIWVAPLQVSMYSTLARYRQDLFIHDENGSLLLDENSPVGPLLLLDYSLPEVQQLVSGWFSDMRHAGFELFKIDYIYEAYLRKTLTSRNSIGKIGFARKIFETIRRAVGEDSHVINCGGSKEAALGLVDSSRVTVDIHNFWGHIRNNSRQLCCSFWMNHNLWLNDPDFAIIRNSDYCSSKYKNMPYTKAPLEEGKPFWMKGNEATRDEMRVWLSAVRLNGGNTFLSDSMQTLNSNAINDLDKLYIPPLKKGFIPLDLFESEYPSILLSKDQKHPTIGFFNWKDRDTSIKLPTQFSGILKGKDFWTAEKVEFKGEVKLLPHSVRLIEF